ncbi:hypothetical protein [Streptomyces sp. NPDC093149]|uniref:hypothetical protein n=1 Tax=Streptomyces sp. NPDC093149 TaxID=3366031 RepID=UPI003815D9CC
MPEHSTTVRDVATLKVARVGRVEKTDDPLRPFRLVDADGIEVAAVSEFLHHMLADDASPTSLRSYAYELLAWVRFLRAVDVPWHLASRVEARDFALWLKRRRRRPGRLRSRDQPPEQHLTAGQGHRRNALTCCDGSGHVCGIPSSVDAVPGRVCGAPR